MTKMFRTLAAITLAAAALLLSYEQQQFAIFLAVLAVYLQNIANYK